MTSCQTSISDFGLTPPPYLSHGGASLNPNWLLPLTFDSYQDADKISREKVFETVQRVYVNVLLRALPSELLNYIKGSIIHEIDLVNCSIEFHHS